MSAIKLKLGCFGRTDDGFISCNSIENTIFTLESLNPLYSDIMDFFDQMQLFDRALMDYNAVRNVIFNMRKKFSYVTKPIWSEKEFIQFQKWTMAHQECGIYLKLEFGE